MRAAAASATACRSCLRSPSIARARAVSEAPRSRPARIPAPTARRPATAAAIPAPLELVDQFAHPRPRPVALVTCPPREPFAVVRHEPHDFFELLAGELLAGEDVAGVAIDFALGDSPPGSGPRARPDVRHARRRRSTARARPGRPARHGGARRSAGRRRRSRADAAAAVRPAAAQVRAAPATGCAAAATGRPGRAPPPTPALAFHSCAASACSARARSASFSACACATVASLSAVVASSAAAWADLAASGAASKRVLIPCLPSSRARTGSSSAATSRSRRPAAAHAVRRRAGSVPSAIRRRTVRRDTPSKLWTSLQQNSRRRRESTRSRG